LIKAIENSIDGKIELDSPIQKYYFNMLQALTNHNILPNQFRDMGQFDWDALKLLKSSTNEKMEVLNEMKIQREKMNAEMSRRLNNG